MTKSMRSTSDINSVREGDWILFYHEGGVDVGDVDAKASKILIPVDIENEYPSDQTIILHSSQART